jgi:hypothetical protein
MSERNHGRDKRRNTRRIPLNSKVRIKVPETNETHYGVCRDLSVDGISFETDYVPRFGQILEILVMPPQPSGLTPPLHAIIEVRHCARANAGEHYEIGAAIVKIKG